MKILTTPGYAFDDVLLEPRYTPFDSRFNGEIDLSTDLPGLGKLSFPIISANMDTVTGKDMCGVMNSVGGVGIHHRFLEIKDHVAALLDTPKPRIGCIGVGSDTLERAQALVLQAGCCALQIDVAHAHAASVERTMKTILDVGIRTSLWVGNVATAAATEHLIRWGAEVIKVGIGPGSLCTTRIMTGCGVPQLTAIQNCAEITQSHGCHIIADGGIKSSGDIVKALAAGANAVMIGSLLSGTHETPGEIIETREHNHIYRYKKYRGCASKEFQEEVKGYASSVEGEAITVPYLRPAADILQNLRSGILSGMSYQGASNLSALQDNATFIVQSYAGHRESVAHGVL